MINKWDALGIIKALQDMKSKGEELSPGHLQRKHGGMYGPLIKIFGSLDEAFSKAGLDLTEVRQRRKWDDMEILAEILLVNEIGVPLDQESIIDEYGIIFHAAKNHFGSWKKAVEESGLNYKEIKKSAVERRISQRDKEIPEEDRRIRWTAPRNDRIYTEGTFQKAESEKKPKPNPQKNVPTMLEGKIHEVWTLPPKHTLTDIRQAYKLFLSSEYPRNTEGERQFYQYAFGYDPDKKYSMGNVLYVPEKRKFGRITQINLTPLNGDIVERKITLQLIDTKRVQQKVLRTKKKLP